VPELTQGGDRQFGSFLVFGSQLNKQLIPVVFCNGQLLFIQLSPRYSEQFQLLSSWLLSS